MASHELKPTEPNAQVCAAKVESALAADMGRVRLAVFDLDRLGNAEF